MQKFAAHLILTRSLPPALGHFPATVTGYIPIPHSGRKSHDLWLYHRYLISYDHLNQMELEVQMKFIWFHIYIFEKSLWNFYLVLHVTKCIFVSDYFVVGLFCIYILSWNGLYRDQYSMLKIFGTFYRTEQSDTFFYCNCVKFNLVCHFPNLRLKSSVNRIKTQNYRETFPLNLFSLTYLLL